jgi:hypothetical protein
MVWVWLESSPRAIVIEVLVPRAVIQGTAVDFFFLILIFFIHMCIQGLGNFSPLPHPLPYHPLDPFLSPQPPRYPAETILPVSLILLKREYKQ